MAPTPETVRFPMLYRKSSTGKVRTWEITVEGSTMYTEAGIAGGKITESVDKIDLGKNIGKANATSPHGQALMEAAARWQLKVDKGYRKSLDEAIDDVDAGPAYFPMLAKTFDPETYKGPRRVLAQMKLDGLRAVNDGGKFYSRTRKPFRDMPHITNELKDLGLLDVPLDGEFYCHALKDDFESIVSAIKRGSSDHPMLEQIEFHVFDVRMPGTFEERNNWLQSNVPIFGDKVQLLPAIAIDVHAAEVFCDEAIKAGFEGLMIRNPEGPYLSSPSLRSPDLLKYKKFQDAEFPVVGITEGRGKLKGHVGSFVCQINEETFEVKMEGRLEFLKQCFEDHSLWRGKCLTVKFQSYTNKRGVPRFPIGLRLRENE